jgi:hypothetical protein
VPGTELRSSDILELISLLNRHRVRYLLVGGEAVISYGHIRLTGDVDFFYEASVANAENLHAALADFWGPEIPGVADAADLLQEGQIIQFGMPPNRIDSINRIDGVEFDDAWPTRTVAEIDVIDGRVPRTSSEVSTADRWS